MPAWAWMLIIAADVVITAAILWWVFAKRRMDKLGGLTFTEFMRFSKSAGQIAGDYMRANYSGHSSQLPAVLPGLMQKLEEHARAKGVALERATLKALLPQLLATQNLAPVKDVQAALASMH